MPANFATILSFLLVLTLGANPTLEFAISVARGSTDDGIRFSNSSALGRDGTINDHLLTNDVIPFQVQLTRPCTFAGRLSGPLYIHDKQFTVYYDLGSDTVVVPLTNGNKDFAKLDTYTPNGPVVANNAIITYGGGTTAQGAVYSDTVGVDNGANALPNFQFIAATTLPNLNDIQGQSLVDGILGMTPKNIIQANKPNLPLFFPTLFDANAGSQRRLSLLPQSDGSSILTVGGDHAGYAAVDVFPVAGADGHWQIALASVSIAGNNQNFVSNAAGANNLGVVDTGSATIVGSSAAIASIYALVPTYKLKSNSFRGTCGTFPDLHFTFQGSANTYTVSGNLLEVKTAVGDCIALINGIANFPPNIWLLGVPFLRSVYAQFNLGATNGPLNTYTIGLSQQNIPAPSAASNTIPKKSCVIL